MSPTDSPPPGGRTEHEREAARLEREAAREQRERARSAHGPAAAIAVRENPPEVDPPARRRGSYRARAPRARAPVSRLRARIAALASLVLVGVVVWLLVSIFQPFHGAGHGRVVVVIPAGAGAQQVGSILARDGVVSSAFFFDIHSILDGARGDLHSGRFMLAQGMSYSEAIDALTARAPETAVVKVVIPEGETRPQIAAIVRARGLKGNYMRASRHVAGFEPSHYGAHGHPSLEGFLFPATYDVPAHASVSRLVDEQLEAFNERFGPTELAGAHKLHITPYQLLIVASMIEREAKLPRDRPLVAAVIYNRLRLGMPLGVDATLRFALRNYNRPLTETQLKTPSPYNTRLHTGLPPTPIANPGMESIEAAVHPAHAGYLYYVDGADGCGDLVFSSDYAHFEADAAAYNAAVQANGGKMPACKHK